MKNTQHPHPVAHLLLFVSYMLTNNFQVLVQHFPEVCCLPRLSEWAASRCFFCLWPSWKYYFRIRVASLVAYKATEPLENKMILHLLHSSLCLLHAVLLWKMNKWNVPLQIHFKPKYWTALPEPPLVCGVFYKKSP